MKLDSEGRLMVTDFIRDFTGISTEVTFVGRGDMSRGGLLLRAVSAGVELEYTRVRGAVLHGQRPPKLERRPRG